MNRIATLSIMACALLCTVPAKASTIDIGLAQTPGIGSITTVATGSSTSGASWAGSYDGYLFNLISANGSLNSSAIDVALPSFFGGATGPIYLYVTEAGVTSAQSIPTFLTNLSVTNLSSGWTVTETAYVDTTNTLYGTGTQLASLTGLGTQSLSQNVNVGSSPFSLTEVYAINSNGNLGLAYSSQSVAVTPLPPTIPLF